MELELRHVSTETDEGVPPGNPAPSSLFGPFQIAERSTAMRIVFLSTFVAAIACASVIDVSSTNQTTKTPTESTTLAAGDCSEEQDHGQVYFALIALLVLGILFLVAVVLSLVIYVTKVNNKVREAETHLHQVIDAILSNSIPKSIITEIGLIAEEAQKKK